MTISFKDKVVIVTGAGGGLGRAHALEFARRGAKVVINDLGGALDGTGGNSAAAEKVVAEIKAAGGDAIANGASVSDDAGAQHLIKQTMDAYGRVDALIANAGILRDKSFGKMELKDFTAVVDVHTDIINGVLFKSLAFGAVVSLIAVFQGFTTPPTSEGVAYATTRTVVASSIAILALDFVLTAFLM